MARKISKLADGVKPLFYKAVLFGGLQFALVYSAYAATVMAPDITFRGPEDINSKILCPIFGVMFDIALVLSALMFFVSGFMYLTAGGDPEKVKKASKTLTYAFIGTAVALISKGVPLIIGNFLGASGISAC